MSKTARSLLRILPLQDCVDIAESEIGQRAAHLTQLYWQHIPLPESYVIPATFLEHIFRFNHFDEQFDQIFKNLDVTQPESLKAASEQIHYLIYQLKFPEDASNSLLSDYTQWMEGTYVALRPSFISDIHNIDHLSELNIKGEANITESFLHLWAKFYQTIYLPKRLEEWQNHQFIPAAIVIQRMIESTSSGFALTDELNENGKATIEIFSTWGVAEKQEPDSTHMDTFEIELATRNILNEHIAIKKNQFVHQLDCLEEIAVPFLQQAESSLNLAQLEELVGLVMKVRQKFLTPHIVEWAAEGLEMYILNIRPQHQKHPSPKPQPKPLLEKSAATPNVAQPTNKTQLLVAVEADAGIDQALLHQTQGIGFVKSEHLWQTLPEHPLQSLRHHRAEVLKNALVKSLLPLAQVNANQSLIYRSLNLSSEKLRALPHGSEFEPNEPNPYLGYRGGVRILHNYELFDLELDAISDVHHQTKCQIGILVPFVRTSSELALLQRHVSKPKYATAAATELWLECDTPENILQIDQYLQHHVRGICINAQRLHCLLLGLDPSNQDITKLYPTDYSLLASLLRELHTKTTATQTSVYLYLNEWSREGVDLASELECDAVVVLPKDIQKTQQALQE